MLKNIFIMCFVLLFSISCFQGQVSQKISYQYGQFPLQNAHFDSYSISGFYSQPLILGMSVIGGYMIRYSPQQFQILEDSWIHNWVVGVEYTNNFPTKLTPMYIQTNILFGIGIFNITKFYEYFYSYQFNVEVGFMINKSWSFYGGFNYLRDHFQTREVIQSIAPTIGVKFQF